MFKIFIKFVKRYYRQSLFYFILLILANFCIIYQPLTLNKVLCKTEFAFDTDTILFILLSVFTPLVISYKDRTLNYVTNLMYVDVSNGLIEELLHKNVLEVRKNPPNFIIRIVYNYSWLVSDFYLYTLLDSIISVITAAIMLLLLAQYNLNLSLFVLVCHILRLLIIYSIQSKLQEKSETKVAVENEYLSTFSNYLVKLKTVITRNKADDCELVLGKQRDKSLKASKNLAYWRSLSSTLGQTSFWIIKFMTILFGIYLFNDCGLPILSLQLAFSYSDEIGICLQMFSELLPAHSDLKANSQHVETLRRYKDTKKCGYRDHFSSIQLKNISFSYNDKNVLRSVSGLFEKGNIYAIKGENGSGKSTLAKILSGIYPDYSGEILLNNKSFSDYDIEFFHNNLVSILTQDDLLFEGSIRDNLLSDSEDDIKEICKVLNLKDINRKVNTNGSNLSGGEKRKILLSRFFLDVLKKGPSLMILDEPTYALEQESVKKVLKRIEACSKSCIVLVITHNPDDFENKIFQL